MDLNYAVFLDVDETLLLKNAHVINQALLDQLKTHGYLNIYLFTNMDLGDHEQLINAYEVPDAPKRLSRQHLIDELQRQGFNVLGVMTPADVGYEKEIGAAFRDLYQPAYFSIKAASDDQALNCHQERERHRARNKAYRALFPNKPNDSELSTLAFNKYQMFLYFVRFTHPSNTTHILYLDDDQACLDAVEGIDSDDKQMVKLTTGLVKDGAIDADVNLAYFYSPATAEHILHEAASKVDVHLPKTAKTYIDFLRKSKLSDLHSVNDLVLKYISSKIEKKKKATPFLMALLSHISNRTIQKDNFFDVLNEMIKPRPMRIERVVDIDLDRVIISGGLPRSPRNYFFSDQASSSASSSNCYSPRNKK